MLPSLDSSVLSLVAVAAMAYLLGSIPFGLLISKAMGLGDVRNIGSGNIGATNVLRTGSKPAALATVLLDAGKGLLSVVVARLIFGEAAAQVAGLFAVLGHIYPVWLNFKGGKGVATVLGVLVGLAPVLGLIALGTWIFVFFIYRISSLSALMSSIFTPVVAYILDFRQMLALILLLAALLFWKHRGNIARLVNGEEPTADLGSK